MPRSRSCSAAILLASAFALSMAVSARAPLTFEERVKAQEAIERVYYEHRIWPKENPQPKPPFEEMVPRAVIEAKVTDYLKKCAAAEEVWSRPIRPEEVQGELERIALQSRDPETLREIYTALGDDPLLIAECLARPALADRLVRGRYAADTGLQREAREQADEILRSVIRLGRFPEAGRRPVPSKLAVGERIGLHAQAPLRAGGRWAGAGAEERVATADDLATVRAWFAERAAFVRETEEGFAIVHLSRDSGDALEVETLVLEKPPFGAWWSGRRSSLPIPVIPWHRYEMPARSGGRICSQEWRDLTWNLGRKNHTAVWTGTEMIVWGGMGIYEVLFSGGRYSPVTDAWVPTSTGEFCPEARFNHVALWTGTEMVVWGGRAGYVGSLLNTGGRYDPSSDTWRSTPLGSDCPAAGEGPSAVWTGTEMIIWGGYGAWDGGGRFNPEEDRWRPVSRGLHHAMQFEGHTAIWTGTEMIIWGGAWLGVNLDTGAAYNPTSDTWRPIGYDLQTPSARRDHSAVWTGREMLIWSTGEELGGRYDPATNSWKAMASCPTAGLPVGTATAVWTGAEMLTWGNYHPEIPGPPSGASYDPTSDTWRLLSVGEGCPERRLYHTAVWTGSEMIIWGGWELDSGRFPPGGRYNPASDSWVPVLRQPGYPAPRHYDSAVWTGAELIVWGGAQGIYDYPALRSGAKYNPALDEWVPTSMEGAGCPQPRCLHGAVWTGREMLLWGGQHKVAYYDWEVLNDGGRYDPVADAWSPISTEPPCPSPREAFSAIWSGTELIVWGGWTTEGETPVLLNSGARYSPELDSWRPTSTGSGCPTGRGQHLSVWAGTEMLIWSGYVWDGNRYSYSGEGARYRPGSDAWVPMSVGGGCPSGRGVGTAVWTGSEMIVWGGGVGDDSGVHSTDTGGIYNPAADTWIPTPLGEGCPEQRWAHSATWTGKEMVVWGGTLCSACYSMATGGVLDRDSLTWKPTLVDRETPMARYHHRAAWTGGSMVISGGLKGYGGYRMDLVQNGLWLPSGAPDVFSACAGEDLSECDTGVLLQWDRDPLRWNDNGDDGRSYRVFRDGSPLETGGCSQELPYGVTTCIDETNSGYGSYRYQVGYRNSCGGITAGMAATVRDSSHPVRAFSPIPVDGAIVMEKPLTLQWDSVEGATSYDVYFGTSPEPPYLGSTADRSIVMPELTSHQTYFWSVIPRNGCGSAPWSPTWSFLFTMPPAVTSIYHKNNPFRVFLEGREFHPDIQVYLAGETTAWAGTVYGSARLKLKGARYYFPKDGSETLIRLRNGDGGVSTVAYNSKTRAWRTVL